MGLVYYLLDLNINFSPCSCILKQCTRNSNSNTFLLTRYANLLLLIHNYSLPVSMDFVDSIKLRFQGIFMLINIRWNLIYWLYIAWDSRIFVSTKIDIDRLKWIHSNTGRFCLVMIKKLFCSTCICLKL